MKPSNRFLEDMLDLKTSRSEEDVLWRAYRPADAMEHDGDVILTVPFRAQSFAPRGIAPDGEAPEESYSLRVRAYGEDIVRLTISFSGDIPGDDSAMLECHPSLTHVSLGIERHSEEWIVKDKTGRVRLRVDNASWPLEQVPPCNLLLDVTVFPDGTTDVPFMAYDQFSPVQVESTSIGVVERAGVPHRVAFSFHAAPDERFAGTGERFAKMDLAGRTLLIENTDALGVNNRRCYKNVPFYVSSRLYGLFMHTSAHVRLSLADISTRAVQGVIEEPVLDLFVIGGGSLERILYNYRCLTGFPRNVPVWSYGTWVSRMTYRSETEVRTVAWRLCEGDFPCDVLHLDTGWFSEDWICDWEFSKERFPDPPKFFSDMKKQGYRISLWQLPKIGSRNKLLETAKEHSYIPPLKKSDDATASDLSSQEFAGTIDFSNPDAVKWYQGLLEKLLKMGAAAIKTDFGEDIPLDADYQKMPGILLHNLYALLYQKAAWEITENVTGEGIIWARAGWAGCQRYPVHWGGDAASTWDGLTGSIRGGLHLGLSGFAFWSHDVPGFHGVPFFKRSPSSELYVRWTQFGVFTSHLRYHGASMREPYEYPEVSDIVRKWLKLRYSLIPYLIEQGEKAITTGLPVLRALVFHHEDDPTCWHIDDEYYFGDAFLVAPIINSAGVRNVYLPEGEWVDLWRGKVEEGARWLKNVTMPLEHMPVYVKRGAGVKVYPESVQCTDEMNFERSEELIFDNHYKGLSHSILGSLIDL